MKVLYWILVPLAFALATPACKSAKGQICDRLEDLMDEAGNDGGYNRTACEEQVSMTEEGCANFEVISQCWLGAESLSAFGACRGPCERAE